MAESDGLLYLFSFHFLPVSENKIIKPTYSPLFAYCYRTRILFARYWAETEICSIQDDGELKKLKIMPRRHGPIDSIFYPPSFRWTLPLSLDKCIFRRKLWSAL
jgi:hypothetical protein